jgi:zinc/manganese transport system permease protein
MFAHDFVRNAYLAGTCIALACGTVGWFVVLRGQLFAGDALSHVAFVGALAAAVVGLDGRVGLFALTIAIASGMAALGRRGQADDVAIGMVFAWILGIGILLIALFSTSATGGNGTLPTNTLFGSIYSLTAGASWLAAGIALLATLVLLLAVRPLLFATLDPEVAVVRGVPVRALGIGFLVLLAVVAAESTQAVGALLLLGLLAAPAGAAHRLTVDPYRGIALSAALAVGAMWGGLALSYAIPSLPASSAIIGLAAFAYVLSLLAGRRTGSGTGRESRPGPLPVPRAAGTLAPASDEAHFRRSRSAP